MQFRWLKTKRRQLYMGGGFPTAADIFRRRLVFNQQPIIDTEFSFIAVVINF